MITSSLAKILKERGYVYQQSSEHLEEITDGEKRTVYLGVDPTADSIHAGNFAAFMLLRRFADAGHKVILLIGGGTGLIGDPKPDGERTLLPLEEIRARSEKLRVQAQKLLGAEVELVNNYDWLGKLDLIAFLRDTGKYFTANALLKKDAISARLQSEEGISYTEFSYPLLQAYDFWHLFREKGCTVQIGGSDQWGNIVAGAELIRRKEGKTAYALTLPLIVDKTGKKFGKSEGNAIWLDAEKTSPYMFYQFWLNTDDANVAEYLKLFTLLDEAEIGALMTLQARTPSARHAQRALAREVMKLVHGVEEAEKAERVSGVLFGTVFLTDLSEGDIATLRAVAPTAPVSLGMNIVDVLLLAKLASSKREARQFVEGGAVSLGEMDIRDTTKVLEEKDFVRAVALLRRGAREVCVLTLS